VDPTVSLDRGGLLPEVKTLRFIPAGEEAGIAKTCWNETKAGSIPIRTEQTK